MIWKTEINIDEMLSRMLPDQLKQLYEMAKFSSGHGSGGTFVIGNEKENFELSANDIVGWYESRNGAASI